MIDLNIFKYLSDIVYTFVVVIFDLTPRLFTPRLNVNNNEINRLN